MTKVKKDHRKKSLKEEMSVLDVAVDKSSLSANETRKLFKRGNAALNANNFPLAAKHFFKAWEADPDNLGLLTVVAHILSKLGHQAVAIEFLEKAIAKHGLTEDICKVMGEMALSLEMFEAAEKIFAQAVQFNSKEIKYYMNIATALEGQGNPDGAIQFLEEVVKTIVNSSDCWCLLGTLYKTHFKGTAKIQKAFDMALYYNPDNIVALNNFAGALGAADRVEILARRAIKLKPGLAEPHVLLADFLLNRSRVDEAWEHYEYRKDTARGALQTTVKTHEIETWRGQPLNGRTIFLVAEQGIGDEVFYAQAFHKLVDEGASIIIGCDERLVEIFERSFPGSKAFSYVDDVKGNIRYRSFPAFDKLRKKNELTVDYSLDIGSIPLHFWKNTFEIKSFKDGYLLPNESNIQWWKNSFEKIGSKPKIGLSWRSGFFDKSRLGFYVGLENMLQIISEIDADFICLQYDYTQEELDKVKEVTGKSLYIWPEIDLKNDIEANIAMMVNLDLVLGPNIATQMLALACGAKTWLLGTRPWWAWLPAVDNSILHAPKSQYWPPDYSMPGITKWDGTIDQIISSIKEKF